MRWVRLTTARSIEARIALIRSSYSRCCPPTGLCHEMK
jgi:hypothetical protein